MKIEIKNRWNGNIIITGEYESIKEALQKNRDANLHGADLRGANLYVANLHEADLHGADLCEATLRGADLRGANLYGANLYGANLHGANLRGADLRGANLRDANLHWADLYGADLRDAIGITLPIINIIGSSFHFFYMDGIIKIGCEKWPVSHWIENYQSIGETNGYTFEQIEEYGGYIKMVENLIKKEKK